MNLNRLLVLLLSGFAYAQSAPAPAQNPPAPAKIPTVQQTVEVTTRTPEDPDEVPTAVEVITGEDIRSRGATDLRGVLSEAVGVEIAQGGDAGPASSVPEFWGLKEFDAFLLVVDDVPWGGAFNPALATLDLADIERVEVVRGPAPVTYGATSFVGVIHVVRKSVTATDRTLTLHGGSFGSGGAGFSTPIPLAGRWASRLTLDGERMGFRDDRTFFRRGHGLWRVGRVPKGGDSGARIWLNFDLNWLDQDPASPHPRDGATLTPLVAVDANHNPDGAFLNDHRGTVMGGFDRAAGNARWYTNASFSHSRQNIFRGFLEDVANNPDNAHGFRQQIHLTDFYLDSHFTGKISNSLHYLAGADYLHGTGNANGADFDYTVTLAGDPVIVIPPSPLDVAIADHRNLFGVYGSLEWTPIERLRIDAGLRANVTRESERHVDPGAGTDVADDRTDARVGASVGAIFTAWQRKTDAVRLYANYRDTFKPAAIDFGIETFAGQLILRPETSRSVEGGVKARLFDRRLEAEASGFLMNFENLVTAINIGGNPGLINAGKQRFQGFEAGLSGYMPRDLVANATYSFHDAHFTDFVEDFGAGPVQLSGNRLEMSARHLVSFGLRYVRARGFLAAVGVNHRSGVFLDKLNTAPAEGFATVDASAGYRTSRWELRVDARNLGDRRDPVAASELGESEYYLMPSRRVDATLRLHF